MDNKHKRFGKVLKVLVALLASFAFSVIVSSPALAQAWVPPKGEGLVSFTYHRVKVEHPAQVGDLMLSETGASQNRVSMESSMGMGSSMESPMNGNGSMSKPGEGHEDYIDGNAASLSIDYGIFTKLALSVDLPYIDMQYKGDRPHKGGNEEKFGYNRDFQDLSLNLRYMLLYTPLIVTPFIELQMPTTDYETHAHSAIGKNLRAFLVGTHLGRRLQPILPGGYIQGRYSYAFVERVRGFNLNRSNASLEIGYFLTRSLSLAASWQYQNTHGGLDASDLRVKDYFDIHDRIAEEDFNQIGGGVSFSVNDSFTIYTNYFALSGNIQEVKGITLGTSWNF